MKELESARSRALVDRLREFGLDKYVELPQFAVMGDTSSGKSSVLSALSGISFPSNAQLTTRCPTQLILNHAAAFEGMVHLRRYMPESEHAHVPSKKLQCMEDIEGEIQRLTALLVAEGQSISDDAIVIDVKGPGLPNLTLTDLPGLVRTVSDDEDKNIIEKIRALVNRYLVQSRTVILAVVPANCDMHNTEILQAAEEVDPEGLRTISIITKPDLVDKGAEQAVLDLLMNKKKMLRLGYHAVKCRGQADLDKSMTIAQGLQKEKVFFTTHKVWSKVNADLVGVQKLGNKLSALLEETISNSLPSVFDEIEKRLEECEAQLVDLEDPMETPMARMKYHTTCVQHYENFVKQALDGIYEDAFFDVDSGINRIRVKLHEAERKFQKKMMKKAIQMAYQPVDVKQLERGDYIRLKQEDGRFELVIFQQVNPYSSQLLYNPVAEPKICLNMSDFEGKVYGKEDLSKVQDLLEQSRGDEMPIFPSYNVFRQVIRGEVAEWKKPLQFLHKTYVDAVRHLSQALLQHVRWKPKLKKAFEMLMTTFINELSEESWKKCLYLIENEQRPFTMNHYLFDALMRLRNQELNDAFKALSKDERGMVSFDAVMALINYHGVGTDSNEICQAKELNWALIAYSKVAVKRFTDTAPMLLEQGIMQKFLRNIKDRLCMSASQLKTLLQETTSVRMKRKSLLDELEALRKSKESILSL